MIAQRFLAEILAWLAIMWMGKPIAIWGFKVPEAFHNSGLPGCAAMSARAIRKGENVFAPDRSTEFGIPNPTGAKVSRAKGPDEKVRVKEKGPKPSPTGLPIPPRKLCIQGEG